MEILGAKEFLQINGKYLVQKDYHIRKNIITYNIAWRQHKYKNGNSLKDESRDLLTVSSFILDLSLNRCWRLGKEYLPNHNLPKVSSFLLE
jgi:hypothetical protein